MIKHFLSNACWDDLDYYLIIDTPSGMQINCTVNVIILKPRACKTMYSVLTKEVQWPINDLCVRLGIWVKKFSNN